MTHLGDGLRIGGAYYGRNIGNATDPAGREDLGAPVHTETAVMVPVLLGSPAANDPNGAVVAASATGAATLSITGALASGGIATFDVPRAPSLTSTGNNSGVTVTLVGTEKYGAAISMNVAGPNNTTVNAVKAISTLTAASVDGAITGTLDIGTSSVLGIDYRVDSSAKLLSIMEDGVPATGGTLVAGFAASGTTTATTADVRGTYTPAATMDGSTPVNLLVVVDASSKTELYGADQFGG